MWSRSQVGSSELYGPFARSAAAEGGIGSVFMPVHGKPVPSSSDVGMESLEFMGSVVNINTDQG
jgi:hypothetical protein